jgi:hypothetical protein
MAGLVLIPPQDSIPAPSLHSMGGSMKSGMIAMIVIVHMLDADVVIALVIEMVPVLVAV